MKRILAFAFILFSVFSVGTIAGTAAALEQTTSAKQAVVIDMMTGAVLFEKDANKEMPTSSMSKVMTMYAVFKALKSGRLSLNDELKVSKKAWRKGGSKMFVEVGKKVRVEDLIKGVIVQSGNDASIVFAENLAGSEDNFAQKLNIIAQDLGMKNSQFKNATGWPDEGHYSTAHDLATLAQRLIVDFPEYYHYYNIQEFTFNDIKQANRNPLVYRKMGVDGIKTGHTDIAGYGLMASGERDGRRVVMVANGMDSEKHRAQESARLMEWALSSFENKTLFKSGDIITDIPVLLGKEKSVSLAIETSVLITYPKLQKDEVKMDVIYTEPLVAPVAKGTELGTLRVSIPGQEVKVYPLVAEMDVEEAGFLTRSFEKLILFIQNS
jgi:D-alanyl-D-alanine carboxypeptidase (penicillin-binding protein 5/6)